MDPQAQQGGSTGGGSTGGSSTGGGSTGGGSTGGGSTGGGSTGKATSTDELETSSTGGSSAAEPEGNVGSTGSIGIAATDDATPEAASSSDTAASSEGDSAPTVVFLEEQISSDDVVDFEFDWGRDGTYCETCNFGDSNARFVFTDREQNLWLGYVHPDTGLFEPSDGRAVLLDTLSAFATDFGNGPEWMFSTDSKVVYTKYFPGREQSTFSASVALAEQDASGTWTAAIIAGGVQRQSPSGTLDLDDPNPRINYQDFAKANVFWKDYEHLADEEHLIPISEQTGGGSRRWVPGTHSVIFSGSAPTDEQGYTYQQVFLYDTDTDVLEQLTFDPTTKWGAFMWRAPEFDNDDVFFTIADRTTIKIYRRITTDDGSPWTEINSIDTPATLPYAWSPEPFVYNGRSYIFMQVSSDPRASDMSIPTQLALTGIEPGTPSFRMLTNDSSTRRVRMDPEYFVTTEGAFIYYNRYVPSTDTRPVRNDGVWRIDTRLGPPQ